MSGDFIEDLGRLSDDELYEIVGMDLQGTGLGVSPADRGRFGRFARSWLDNKSRQLWSQIQGTDTYRIWLESAGRDQLVDPDTVGRILVEDDWEPRASAALALLLVRSKTAAVSDAYDIAVSFAENERDYVDRTVTAARALALKVFYDRDMSNTWWGRNFVVERRRIYGQLALHFVPFISAEYLTEPMPRDDFSHAVARAFNSGNRYILPVLVGDVKVPSELLLPLIGFLRAEKHTPEELAAHMRIVVDDSRARGLQPRDFGAVVHDAHRDLTDQP
ncbi:hypothetical protein ABZ345_05300 [Lentzea sp. NPDC005914]|uniref:hypothetical protein n=1 Tax=Lentzea sp. NPDC005914 TaxID=3154572 RepID=UPI0033DFB600